MFLLYTEQHTPSFLYFPERDPHRPSSLCSLFPQSEGALTGRRRGGQSPGNKTATVAVIDSRAALRGGNVPDRAGDPACRRSLARNTEGEGVQPRRQQETSVQRVAIQTGEEMMKIRKPAFHDAKIQNFNGCPSPTVLAPIIQSCFYSQ